MIEIRLKKINDASECRDHVLPHLASIWTTRECFSTAEDVTAGPKHIRVSLLL